MRKIVRLLSLLGLLLFSGLAWGQIGGVDKKLLEWDKDSIWFVNGKFMPDLSPEYNLELTVPKVEVGSDFRKAKILWGDVSGENWSPEWELSAEKKMTHKYQTGSYVMQIGLWKGPDYSGAPDSVQRRFVFNQNLDVKFELLGPHGTCLPENAVDTFIVHYTDMPNPAGTIYQIDVFARNEGIFWGYDSLYRREDVSPDSVYLIFRQPTGLDGVSVSIKMSYEDEESGISLEKMSGSQLVHLFQSPNLDEIFGFSAIPDTVSSFKICAPGAPAEFGFSAAFLRKYQYPRPGSGNPNYDKRTNFQVKYYYTDSVYTDIPDNAWRNVTTNPDYVDTVSMLFKTAGFYRLFVAASNQCGSRIVGGITEYFADTLRTDSIEGKTDRRYIQVYENASDKLFCLNNDIFCINRKDTIWLVDRNQRKSYDPPASYEIETVNKETHVVTDDACRRVATEVYKGGKILSGDISKMGCDSTVMKLVFTKPGNYTVKWSRLTDNCDKKISKSFDFHVGDVPEFVRDTIWANIFKDGQYKSYTVGNDRYFTFCDTFKYTLPDCRELLDSNYVQVDSLGFLFTRGSHDSVVLKTSGQQVFAFDSLGERPNYISLRAKNECGWGYADTVKFFTHEMPHVELLRDSIPGNDTLCANFPYRYYLGGILPRSHGDSILFTGKKLFGSQQIPVADPRKWQPFKDTVAMINPEPGKFQERFLIVNLKAPLWCRQELGPLDLYVVSAPSSLIYQDSVLYCELKEKLETKYLFDVASGDTIFKKVEWSWNNVPVAGKFPELNLKRNGNDTLRFKTSTGSGCYMADSLVFIPKPLPNPDLAVRPELCAPDTIKNYLDFMGSGNNMVAASGSLRIGMTLKVYKNRIVSDSLLYDSYRSSSLKKLALTKKTADSVRLYYVMTDTLPDAGFAGCEKTDSVVIYVFKPRLDVFRSDTLPVGTYTYNCPAPFNKYVDTCDIRGSLTWSYGGQNCDITNTAYQFNFTADRNKDSVALILSGTTRCGDPVQDSLIVHIPHSRLFGYKDTICSNTEGYKLWGTGKTTGNFIDTTTLEWKIIENPGGKDLGTFSSTGGTPVLGKGASVIFKPGADAPGTEVKIEVTGSEGGGIGAKDTVYIRVNPAPDYTWKSPDIKKDTLIIDNASAVGVLMTNRITPLNYSRLSFVKQYGTITCQDTIAKFGNVSTIVNAVQDQVGGAKIKIEGLKGCSAVLTSDTVNFLFPVNVLPKFKDDRYGVCQGDNIGLDSLFTFVRGNDRYTDYSWKLLSGTGQFNVDSTEFKPTNSSVRLELTAYKNYTRYDGTKAVKVRSGIDTVSLVMYAQPSIQLTNGREQDTLCNNVAGMNWGNYLGQWLKVTPVYLNDSLRVNGKRLSQYNFTKPAGKTDTLILTVTMKGCTKWDAAVKDSVFLYRLPKMIAGDFNFPSAICELSRPEINLTGLTIAPEAKSTYWKSTGGTVSGDVPPKFIPTSGRKGAASLTLHVQPPKGCLEDTLRKDFSVYRMPIITLQPDTVCRIPGDVAYVSVGQQYATFVTQISTIEWYRKGNSSVAIGTTSETNPFSYTITQQDSVAGSVELVAKIFAKAPCNGVTGYDTVRIVLQDMPEITFVSPLPKICQGNPLTLAGLANVSGGYQNPQWSASIGAINSEQTQYFPGDNTGDVRLTYRVEGNKKCAGLTKSVTSLPMAINAAPVPTITKSPAILCSRDSITFNASASLSVSGYSWNFGQGIDRTGARVKYGFTGAGNFAVILTATYSGNGCTRSNTEVLTIHEKPVANFLLPQPQIAVGFEITCKNTSTPLSSITQSTWDTDEAHSIEQDFTTSFSTEKIYDIRLKVETAQGCWDTISKRVDVVAPPKASFDLNVDPCTGDVVFNNTSELHNSQIHWDFGDGNIANDELPAPKVYERYYDDTTFMVTLTLVNAAGTASAQKPVKLISKLEPAIDLLPEPEGCHQLVRYLLNKTKGRPDTTTINWGDGHFSGFKGKIDAPLFSHRFENDSTAVVKHTIRLITENVCRKDSVQTVITVHPVNAKAVLGISNAPKYKSQCFGFDWGFLNRSFGFGGNAYKAEWTFEAGVTKQLGSPSDTLIEHSFAEPGYYRVRLRVEDKCNWDTISQVIRVKGNDKLSMNVENKPYCSGQGIQMSAVQQGDFEFSNFVWDFGDGRGSQGKTVTHVYTDPKDAYRVKLSAKADDCPSNDVYYSVNVHRTPGAVIVTADSVGCAPFKIGVRGVDNNHLNPVPSVLWDFRNGAYSGKAVDSVVFSQSGIYNIRLKMTSDVGCIDTATRKINVLYTPRISFSMNDSLFCTDNGNFEVSLTNTSPDIQTCNFNWWRDGLLITNNNNPDKLVFTNASGPVILKLTATHQESGCPAEFARTIVASSRVSAAFDIDVENVCAETPVIFTSNSEHATRLMWLLGDGTISREKEFSHSFRKTGDYPVKLVSANEDGCRDSVEKVFTVYPLPTADFSWERDNSLTGLPDSITVPKTNNGGIKFINYSTVSPADWGTALEYLWDFGDSTVISGEISPRHLFNNNGLYKVWLTVRTAYGCADSVSDLIKIDAVTGLFVPTAFAPETDDPGTNRFEPKGIGLHSYKMQVYSPTGNCVWSSDKIVDGHPAEFWDGKFNGGDAPKGNYIWRASAIFIDGSVWDKGGSVILIR